MSTPNRSLFDNQKGITILEVLIATAVLSASLIVFFQSFSIGAQTSNRSQNHILATLIAESVIERIGNDIPLKNGISSGSNDLSFDWQATISSNEAVKTLKSSSKATLHDVSVNVSWLENGKVRNITLNTAKLRLAK